MSVFTEVIIYQHLQQISHLYLFFVRFQTFILFHFGLNGTKIYKIVKKKQIKSTSNKFAIQKNQYMHLCLVFQKKLIKTN